MQIKALIFDMDGVIMDSMGMWKTLVEDYLRSLGIEPGSIFNTDLQTMNMAQSAAFVKKKFEIEKTEEQIISDISSNVKDFYLNEGEPKTGAADMLAGLKDAGFRICMATATERPLAEAALARNGLLEYFEFIITNSDVGKGKNDPAIFEGAVSILNSSDAGMEYSHDKAAAFFKNNENGVSSVSGETGGSLNEIKKEETMIVEDSLVAVRTATRAGFKACGVYDENESFLFPQLKETADVTVMALEELIDIVGV